MTNYGRINEKRYEHLMAKFDWLAYQSERITEKMKNKNIEEK